MKIANSKIVISAAWKEQWPDDKIPEFAFAGRSNVGKSTLINMLVNRIKLAYTSSRPGKTRIINFYDIDEKIRFVDLPGYGFAKVSKTEKAKWGKMIEGYLAERENLIEVILLVDLRHKPSPDDVTMYNWIKTMGFNGIVIGTKADKVKRAQLPKNINLIRKTLTMDMDDYLLPMSSPSKRGKYDFWDMINQLLEINGFEIKFDRQ
ncbi:ribosome biogenesis GTP-binding protein YihA/YsxC [Clostridiaceae bacterium HSG29]|nr:ribosome biogenesis GTP-binding protein YihA/YsxC [Clostridiaceae bacterium HSG29]